MSARCRLSNASLAAWVLLAAACLQPPPDVGPLQLVHAEDTRLVVLLREADRVGVEHEREAARMIREELLPLARANVTAAAALRPIHPVARRLAGRSATLLRQRVESLQAYAAALESGDPAALLAAVRQQRELEDALRDLDRRVLEASHAPATRGCSRSP